MQLKGKTPPGLIDTFTNHVRERIKSNIVNKRTNNITYILMIGNILEKTLNDKTIILAWKPAILTWNMGHPTPPELQKPEKETEH